MSDQGSRTVEDAAEAWTREYVPDPPDHDPEDAAGHDADDKGDGPCCNYFDCPCGGSGAVGR